MPQNAHIVKNFPFEINERSVLRHQGYLKSSRVSERVRALLDDAIEKTRSLARPAGIWKVEDIVGGPLAAPLPDVIGFSGGLEIASKQVVRLMRGCVKAVLFAVTVGPELESEVGRMIQEGEMAEAVMLDSVASEAVEGCANHLNKLVQSDAHRHGLHLTPRFSPGYGDWTVDHQPELFAALDPGKIGIHLTASCMMIPRKSISAILGLGPIDAIRTGASPCKACRITKVKQLN